jgi:hypothetical protein
MDMPSFVASTTQTVVTSFVDLFTTVLAYVVTDLWPYLIGIALIITVVGYGRRLLRIGSGM